MKKLLITGHRGLLGSACLSRFTGKYEILTTTVDYLIRGAVDFYFKENKPDLVIHCAAKVGGVGANKTQPVEFLLENLIMQNNVLQAAAFHDVEKLIFIGTSCMFPRDAAIPIVEESLMTGKLEDSVEAYSIAKLAGWRLCKAYYEQYGKKFITVNPSNIYGLNDNYRQGSAHVIPALISRLDKCVQDGSSFTVWGDGSAVREFIYADDVADAIGVIMERYDSPEVINCGTGIGHSIAELVSILTEIIGKPKEIIWDTSNPTGIPRKTFNVNKLKALGWEPKVNITEGIIRSYKDFKTNGKLRK